MTETKPRKNNRLVPTEGASISRASSVSSLEPYTEERARKRLEREQQLKDEERQLNERLAKMRDERDRVAEERVKKEERETLQLEEMRRQRAFERAERDRIQKEDLARLEKELEERREERRQRRAEKNRNAKGSTSDVRRINEAKKATDSITRSAETLGRTLPDQTNSSDGMNNKALINRSKPEREDMGLNGRSYSSTEVRSVGTKNTARTTEEPSLGKQTISSISPRPPSLRTKSSPIQSSSAISDTKPQEKTDNSSKRYVYSNARDRPMDTASGNDNSAKNVKSDDQSAQSQISVRDRFSEPMPPKKVESERSSSPPVFDKERTKLVAENNSDSSRFRRDWKSPINEKKSVEPELIPFADRVKPFTENNNDRGRVTRQEERTSKSAPGQGSSTPGKGHVHRSTEKNDTRTTSMAREGGEASAKTAQTPPAIKTSPRPAKLSIKTSTVLMKRSGDIYDRTDRDISSKNGALTSAKNASSSEPSRADSAPLSAVGTRPPVLKFLGNLDGGLLSDDADNYSTRQSSGKSTGSPPISALKGSREKETRPNDSVHLDRRQSPQPLSGSKLVNDLWNALESQEVSPVAERSAMHEPGSGSDEQLEAISLMRPRAPPPRSASSMPKEDTAKSRNMLNKDGSPLDSDFGFDALWDAAERYIVSPTSLRAPPTSHPRKERSYPTSPHDQQKDAFLGTASKERMDISPDTPRKQTKRATTLPVFDDLSPSRLYSKLKATARRRSAISGISRFKSPENEEVRLSPTEAQLLPPVLLSVKGKRRSYLCMIPKTAGSVGNADCYITYRPLASGAAVVPTGSPDADVIVWTGSAASKAVRAKTIEFASQIKDFELSGKGTLIFEEGKNDTKPSRFWETVWEVGTPLPSIDTSGFAADEEDFERRMEDGMVLYGFSDDQPREVCGGRELTYSFLETGSTFVLDCRKASGEIYAWCGKNSSEHDRELACRYAEALADQVVAGAPELLVVDVEREKMEKICFRGKFPDWPSEGASVLSIKQAGNVVAADKKWQVYDRGSDVAKRETIDVIAMHAGQEPMPEPITDRGTVSLQVWMFSDSIREEIYMLPAAFCGDSKTEDETFANRGIFYSTESYVVLYRYKANRNREAEAVFLWIGEDCKTNLQGAASIYASELCKTHNCVTVRLEQGKELACFLAIFGGSMIIRKIDRPNFRTSKRTLYHVYGYTPESTRTEQASFTAASLCSGYSFVVNQKDRVYVWHGNGSLPHERSVALKVAKESVAYGREVVELAEGREPKPFWLKLDKYTRNYTTGEVWLDRPKYGSRCAPRLFRISHVVHGNPSAEELRPFRYRDLDTSCVYLLDAFFELFVWIGEDARGLRDTIKLALESCMAYVQYVHKKEKRDRIPTTAVFGERGEPPEFQAQFQAWPYHGSESGALHKVFNKMAPLLRLRRETRFPTAEEVLETFMRERYTAAELKEELPFGVDPRHVDDYLYDEEFPKLFKMSKEEFKALPAWRQIALKKSSNLYKSNDS